MDPGGSSEGSGGQEVDPTELMGLTLSQRLPLVLGRKN